MPERREKQSSWVDAIEYAVHRGTDGYIIIRRGRAHVPGYGTKSEPFTATLDDCVWRDFAHCERTVEYAEAKELARTLTEAQL